MEIQRKKITIDYSVLDDGTINASLNSDFEDLCKVLIFGGKLFYDAVLTSAINLYLMSDDKDGLVKAFFKTVNQAQGTLTKIATEQIAKAGAEC